MITAAMSRRARSSPRRARRSSPPRSCARSARPACEAGDVALVLADGTIEGFVGGVCAEQSVRAYSLQAIETGEARAAADRSRRADRRGPRHRRGSGRDGAVTVQNPCLSGGAIEVFLEPCCRLRACSSSARRRSRRAVRALGAELGLDVVAVDGERLEPRPGDLALVVAAHGRDELHTLRRGLEAGVPYVGLVASRKRGAGVLAELRGDGVPRSCSRGSTCRRASTSAPARPAEIALSILAQIVAVRRGERASGRAPAPRTGGAAASAARADWRSTRSAA